MRFSGRDQQKGGRRPAVAARWLMDGSLPAWARRSMAGIGLPASRERRECRESASASPPASACSGQAGRAAAGGGLSVVLRRLRPPMRHRGDAGQAVNPGNGTGGRPEALARSG